MIGRINNSQNLNQPKEINNEITNQEDKKNTITTTQPTQTQIGTNNTKDELSREEIKKV